MISDRSRCFWINTYRLVQQNRRSIDFGWVIFFSKHLRTQRRLFQKQRTTLARKLQNPRLRQIHFHTFRHWKATQLYHQTRDILHVMQFLGHRVIKNTLKYVQLEEALFQEANEEFTCKVAGSLEEAKALIEAGFDHVCELNGAQLFRKRK